VFGTIAWIIFDEFITNNSIINHVYFCLCIIIKLYLNFLFL